MPQTKIKGTLYIVATPIGHLADISQRARDVLADVDLIAAEDTRHSSKLLQHLAINTPMLSLHNFNEDKRIPKIMACLAAGENVALISDAGTPLIADPGYRIVAAAREQAYRVVPIPGPCAIIAALSAAGLPAERFVFEGFLPVKSGKRQQRLQQLMRETRTMVLYEAPHRIVQCLQELTETLGPDRQVVLARELTKLFETFWSGSCFDAVDWLQQHSEQQQGEFVVMIAGNDKPIATADEEEALRILTILTESLSQSQAAKLTAKITGLPKQVIYNL